MRSPQAHRIDPRVVEAAVFDLGGVLIDGGPREVVTFGERIGLDRRIWDRLRGEIFGNGGVWARLERGEVSLDDFTEELERRVREAGAHVTREQATTFMGEPRPLVNGEIVRTRMVEAVAALKERVPTALLTNNVREWRSGWRSVLDHDRLFDVVVDSSEVGARKPEPEIYEITRERLGVPHTGIFFVDDIGQNLKAARKLGWQTVLYEDMDAVLSTIAGILALR